MPRPVLTPATAARSEWPDVSLPGLASNIRKFGFVPNLNALLPGDVLLVTAPRSVPLVVRTAQRSYGFSPEHARWTHAALYIGDGQIIEATLSEGVRAKDMIPATFRYDILVRRRLNPPLSDAQRCEIVALARETIGKNYGTRTVVRLSGQAVSGGRAGARGHTTPHSGDTAICSGIVQSVYFGGVGLDLVPSLEGDVAWPGHLSETGKLTDISIGWLKVATE